MSQDPILHRATANQNLKVTAVVYLQHIRCRQQSECPRRGRTLQGPCQHRDNSATTSRPVIRWLRVELVRAWKASLLVCKSHSEAGLCQMKPPGEWARRKEQMGQQRGATGNGWTLEEAHKNHIPTYQLRSARCRFQLLFNMTAEQPRFPGSLLRPRWSLRECPTLMPSLRLRVRERRILCMWLRIRRSRHIRKWPTKPLQGQHHCLEANLNLKSRTPRRLKRISQGLASTCQQGATTLHRSVSSHFRLTISHWRGKLTVQQVHPPMPNTKHRVTPGLSSILRELPAGKATSHLNLPAV